MTQRTFIPGSEWLYFKLYTGHKSADRLLTDIIQPMTSKLLNDGSIADFFFIRYSDPKPHVRLRFRIAATDHYGRIFQATTAAFGECIDNGLLADVVCATYQRELERYGSRTIEVAERLFGADSRAVIGLLEHLAEVEDPEQDRWLLSLRLLDDTLTLFGCDMETKSTLMEQVSLDFRSEFGCNKQPYSKQLDDKYRAHRELIETTLGNGRVTDNIYAKLLSARRKEMEPIAGELRRLELDGEVQVPFDSLLRSYMHMTMNRLFRSKNRMFEMVIYHFLSKYYKSALARMKYVQP